MSTDTEGHDPKEEGAGFGPDAPEATTDSNNSGTGAETHLPVSPLDIAHDCLVRGFSPVPVPYKGKNPGRKGWHTLVITADNVGKYFNGARMNVGVQLGPKSNYLTDVDCDSPEAVKLAPYFLPGTDAVFGRKSKPDSHSLYVIKDAPAVGVIKFADPDGKCIIELRLGGDKKGIQTIFPGSVHQSGELIEWTKNGTPVEVPFKQMERIVRSIAIASMVLRHWPKESGSRHDLALCLGGLLVRCGFKSDDIPRFIEIVARAAGDSEFLDRGKAAASSVETFLKNGKTYGRPKLIELLGEKASSIIKLLPRADLQIVGVQLDDFRAYMPMHNYVYMPTREPWPAASVNARLGLVTVEGAFDEKGNPVKIPASTWLDQNRSVEQMTWAPGFPNLISNRLIADGGWIERPDVTTLNLYRPPLIVPGDPDKVGPWLNHLHKMFCNEDVGHFVLFCAQRVQQPGTKINHAVVIIGGFGIGKDTALEPLKYAVGPWNFIEVRPDQLVGRFNGFLKSVVLRISEVHDLGEMTRYQFYERTKTYIASPPDVHRVDEKNLREHAILNVNGVIMTTNYKEGGMFLPPNDRRHFVMYSPLTEDDFAEVGYWKKLWDWYYKEGGFQHVAAYLRGVDLSGFDPKAPPPKTKAFFDIVNSNRGQEEGEMADVFDLMKNPEVVTLDDIRHNSGSFPELSNWLAETRNRRVVPYRLKTVGYVPVYNPDAKDGLFKVRGRRVSIYAKEPLSVVDQLKAVTKYLADQEGKKPKPWEK